VLLAQSVGRASKAEQLRLALTRSDRVLRLSWLTLVAEQANIYREVVLPLSRFLDLEPSQLIPADLGELARDHGVTLGRAEEFATYVEGDDAVCSQLHVPAGTYLLKLDRLTRARDGAPVEWRVAYTVADFD
jgi:DNA-binding GntR family transcriptional regulator